MLQAHEPASLPFSLCVAYRGSNGSSANSRKVDSISLLKLGYFLVIRLNARMNVLPQIRFFILKALLIDHQLFPCSRRLLNIPAWLPEYF